MTEILTDSAMWEECKHGLPVGSCSSCRHPYKPPPKPTVLFTTVASYIGHCSECNLQISSGDVIARLSDDRWVHEGCAE